MTVMTQAETVPTMLPAFGGSVPQGLELRHLRYFVAVADAGTFTHAAERMYIAQPTLSQQIRRLEQIVGTPLLQRRREGLRLTPASTAALRKGTDTPKLGGRDRPTAVGQGSAAAGAGSSSRAW